MQAVPLANNGTLASNSRVNVALMHQQGGWPWPVCWVLTMAQLLFAPHKGQHCGGKAKVSGATIVSGLVL